MTNAQPSYRPTATLVGFIGPEYLSIELARAGTIPRTRGEIRNPQMENLLSNHVLPNPWHRLRQLTPARIALGRAGGSLPTRELLDFQLAHALARDAVQQPFDTAQLARELAVLGQPIMHLATAASDRQTYLLRPDLGRMLSDESRERLGAISKGGQVDLSITLSDGLSALAAHRQIPALLAHLLPLLRSGGFSIAPLAIVPFARVALQDCIGHALGTKVSLILLGERPGLGSPDSLGAYLVFNPRPGNTDADRNCVSNIRPEGLPPPAAAELLCYLLTQSLRRQLSGVGLKDDRPAASAAAIAP